MGAICPLSISDRVDEIVRISRNAEAGFSASLWTVPRASYRFAVDFSDSTFTALNLAPEEPLSWGRMLVLALVLTLAAASAGILAGGLLL